MPEILDIFDADGKALQPATSSIDAVHASGLWHRSFACWLVNVARGTVILQKRGPRNRIDAGSYDASASGHLSAGETPDDGWRELCEELGVVLSAADRLPIGVFRNQAVRGSYINNEFCYVFLGRFGGSLDDMQPQAGEVADVAEVKIADAAAVFSGSRSEMTARSLSGGITLQLADMCNHAVRGGEKGYYLNVMRAAADLADGRLPHPLPPL